jgi:hypothetical protein
LHPWNVRGRTVRTCLKRLGNLTRNTNGSRRRVTFQLAFMHFPKQRKEPLTDAEHVRNAVARFDQVIDVSDEDRDLAFANIQKAARHYGVNLSEGSWYDLGIHRRKRRKAPPGAL